MMIDHSVAPLISIIVPAYNAGKTIERTIASILAQDYLNWELIIVNDGSQDDTEIKCRAVADSRIRTLSKENGGESSARNMGLEYAKGTYVCFVDSDDWVESNYLTILYQTLCRNGAELSICGMIRDGYNYSSKNTFLCSEKYINGFNNEYFIKLFENGLINSPCNKLYKRSIIDDLCLKFSGRKLVEDIEFNLLYIQAVKVISVTDEILYHYVQTENSLTTRISEDMFDNYLYIHSMFKNFVPERFYGLVGRFVYHQYVSIIVKYIRLEGMKLLPGKSIYTLLNKRMDEFLVKEAFDAYHPYCVKENIIHYLIKWRCYFIIWLYFKVSNDYK